LLRSFLAQLFLDNHGIWFGKKLLAEQPSMIPSERMILAVEASMVFGDGEMESNNFIKLQTQK